MPIRNSIFVPAVVIFSIIYSPFTQAQQFLWAEGDNEYNNDEYKGLAIDADGNFLRYREQELLYDTSKVQPGRRAYLVTTTVLSNPWSCHLAG